MKKVVFRYRQNTSKTGLKLTIRQKLRPGGVATYTQTDRKVRVPMLRTNILTHIPKHSHLLIETTRVVMGDTMLNVLEARFHYQITS